MGLVLRLDRPAWCPDVAAQQQQSSPFIIRMLHAYVYTNHAYHASKVLPNGLDHLSNHLLLIFFLFYPDVLHFCSSYSFHTHFIGRESRSFDSVMLRERLLIIDSYPSTGETAYSVYIFTIVFADKWNITNESSLSFRSIFATYWFATITDVHHHEWRRQQQLITWRFNS